MNTDNEIYFCMRYLLHPTKKRFTETLNLENFTFCFHITALKIFSSLRCFEKRNFQNSVCPIRIVSLLIYCSRVLDDETMN